MIFENIGVMDRSTARYKPFKLTPRRKEILWHIAYDFEVNVNMRPAYGQGRYWEHPSVPEFFLGHTNVHQIVLLLNRAKLVQFKLWASNAELHITPLGMEVLLATLD